MAGGGQNGGWIIKDNGKAFQAGLLRKLADVLAEEQLLTPGEKVLLDNHILEKEGEQKKS